MTLPGCKGRLSCDQGEQDREKSSDKLAMATTETAKPQKTKFCQCSHQYRQTPDIAMLTSEIACTSHHKFCPTKIKNEHASTPCNRRHQRPRGSPSTSSSNPWRSFSKNTFKCAASLCICRFACLLVNGKNLSHHRALCECTSPGHSSRSTKCAAIGRP